MKQLETKRLILREWNFSDSDDLYEYAKNELVGPNAGWSPHKSETESKEIIKMFIESQETYAIQLKESNKVIGSIGLHKRDNSNNQSEIGYVLNPDYWGQGIIPEAVERIKEYGFIDLSLDEIWCAHFDFNHKSKRVNEKCGFKYQFTKKDILKQLNDKEVNTLYYCILKSEYTNI